ncbi:endonuclease domain-containing protein [Streptomyces sp. INA 01156]
MCGAVSPWPGSYGHARRPDLRCAHVLYRLTCDEYEAMRDRAQDRCELCGIPDHETPRGQLVIDHFEAQRVAFFVRGLLCDRCNSVMQRHDGSAPWGPASRPFAEKARAYHLNAFSQPGTRSSGSPTRRSAGGPSAESGSSRSGEGARRNWAPTATPRAEAL